jgi:ubiquitin C-terminal hydrolase
MHGMIRACLNKEAQGDLILSLSRHCPKCKTLRAASKQLTLAKLPDVLMIHLKRFSFDGPFNDKLETMVDFPIQ